MLTIDEIEARRALIAQSPELLALRDHLIGSAQAVLERMPVVPQVKALLSRDGGVCPDDGTQLQFDPWSPTRHRCPRCGLEFTGPRHHAHWARAQHLWIAERAAHLATVFLVTGDTAARDRARELLAAYHALYHQLPNRDNVLGPSHLFFSTYLESVWILDYLAAAFLLREADVLDQAELDAVDAIADEAATIISEFNEGMSNRQTWNSAALTAIAAWFGDEALALTAIEGRTGLLGHLADGFGSDGMWFEGENYHLFAMRGLMIGLQWANLAGTELLADPKAAAHLGQALMAPADSSLPDFTFPARKDARYGVSLAHPAYLETWEAGLATLGAGGRADMAGWLATLYQTSPRLEQTYDAYLHDAGLPPVTRRTRRDLSWWALWMMVPSLPTAAAPWSGTSRLMAQQRLAVIRQGQSYWSLECGSGGGGHGHPDRLHLTVHADGVHWLPDPGAGSYLARDLFWYRSTLAHNAPMLDGSDQPAGPRARCVAFAVGNDWAWTSGVWGDLRRSLVVGRHWALDVVQLDAPSTHQVDLPWHASGVSDGPAGGEWQDTQEGSEFVTDVARFAPRENAVHRVAWRRGDHTLALWYAGDGDLLRAVGPGLPGTAERRPFYVRRAVGRRLTFATVIDPSNTVTSVEWSGGTARVTDAEGDTTILLAATSATISTGAARVELTGVQPVPLNPIPVMAERPPITLGHALWVDQPPALDGSLRGFDRAAPLRMHEEYHYFRSEMPFPGPENLSAIAYVNWSDDALYVAVDVTKPDLVIRDDAAAPLNLDNESDDINADGLQIYVRGADAAVRSWLIRPAAANALRVRAIEPGTPLTGVVGAWRPFDGGYRITVQLPCPELATMRRRERLPFDLIVNEMVPARVRRSGQLVWSGGPGWVYLRGDRQDPEHFGELELAG